jgi:predicted Zn-dependent protease
MNRWISFALVVTVGIAALVWSERHPADVRVDPAALLYFVADSEWELSRLPVSVARMSDQEEIDIGNRMAAHTWPDRRGRGPAQKPQDQLVVDYVTRVGAKVAARAHRKLPYKFHYIPSMDFVNAFALPGGHVYVGAGLMALIDSEDELAAVLGHEIEHIDHYHCAERVQTEQRLRKIPLGALAAIPVAVFEAGYSKDQELEADREGTQLAVWAGYSPLGSERLFETYARLYEEYVRRAQSPQEELSRMAIDTIEGYFRSHPLPSERVGQIRRMITDQHWELTPERDLEVAYIFWTARAQRAYDAGHYSEATGWAQRSLKTNPDQPTALRVLADAQFAQADFAGAVSTFAKALEKTPDDDNLLTDYGDALAARHTPAESLQEFEAFQAKHLAPRLRPIPGVELAGLTLLARGRQAGEAVITVVSRPPGIANAGLSPELRGRWGWWYYRAGDFDHAAELLTAAVEERPGDATLQIQLGWALVEQRNLEAALQRFEQAGRYPSVVSGAPSRRQRIYSEKFMGVAVAAWRAQQTARSLNAFTSATNGRPEWLNPQWVKALYSPGVAQTLEELIAERNKRPNSLAPGTSAQRYP